MSEVSKQTLEQGHMPDRLANAIRAVLAREGFERISIEAIAEEAGSSRATLYRRYGNREDLFSAFIRYEAAPTMNRCISIMSGAGSPATRLEKALCYILFEMFDHQWVVSALERGVSSAVRKLFFSANTVVSEAIVIPLFSSIADSEGKVANLDIRIFANWTLSQLMDLVADGVKAPDEQRQYIQTFILPVLLNVIEGGEEDIVTIHHKLDELLKRISR